MNGSALRAWWIPSGCDPADLPGQQEPRSLAAMAGDVFAQQDLLFGRSEADKERLRAKQEWHEAVQDTASNLEWLGHPVQGAIQRHLAFCDYQDMMEERDRRRSQAQRVERHEARVAELEAEAVSEHARAEQLSRNFTQAVQGWTAERRRHEEASFRGDNQVRYRTGGQIIGPPY